VLLFINENSFSKEKLIRIAVIDTGFDFSNPRNVKICKTGHKDFSSFSKLSKYSNADFDYQNNLPYDTNGHGTHVAGLIAKYAKNANYCLIFLKYFKDENTGKENLINSTRALKEAKKLKVDIINYSGGGPEPDEDEKKIVLSLLESNVKLVMAAGNEAENIDIPRYRYYPAAYDPRIIVVGALGKNGKRLKSSNYGETVDVYELGEEVESLYLNNRKIRLSGTSQATAIHTGKLIRYFYNNIKKE
jgi:subtilisin family serine protease